MEIELTTPNEPQNIDRSIVDNSIKIPLKSTGIGESLRSARIAMRFSEKDAGARLHLSANIITLMENEDFKNGPSATFMRGYLRSYARLLNIPDIEVEMALKEFGMDTIATKSLAMTPLHTPINNNNSETYVRWITYLIVLVSIGLTFMWWNSHSKDLAHKLTPPAAPVAPAAAPAATPAVEAPTAAAPSVAEPTPTLNAPGSPIATQPIMPDAPTQPVTAPSATPTAVTPAPAPVTAEPSAKNDIDLPVTPTPEVVTPGSVKEPQIATANKAPTEDVTPPVETNTQAEAKVEPPIKTEVTKPQTEAKLDSSETDVSQMKMAASEPELDTSNEEY